MDAPVRDFVIPLVSAEQDGDGVAMRDFLGSSFLLGGRPGYALTARHVVDRSMQGEIGAALVDADNHWRVYAVEVVGFHRFEDVALLRLHPEAPIPDSPFTLETPEVYSSAGYSVWGYPEDVLWEVVEDGRAKQRPDLVYSESHVRRRITGLDLPGIRGSELLELSIVAGGGFSGAPVTLLPSRGSHWDVVGIYIGERTSPTSGAAVGYTTRIDAARELVREHLE